MSRRDGSFGLETNIAHDGVVCNLMKNVIWRIFSSMWN